MSNTVKAVEANNELVELVALNEKQAKIVNSNFKGTLNALNGMSDNFVAIDSLNVSNEEHLTNITTTFNDKLDAFKSQTDVKSSVAVKMVFNTLDITLNTDEVHQKALKVYREFKKYYTSKLFISQANFSYKAITTANKLLKYVPYKTVNSSFKAYALDDTQVKSLSNIVKNVQTITKTEIFNEVSRNDVAELTNHYISFVEGKIVVDKSNFSAKINDTLVGIIKDINIALATSKPLTITK